MENIILFLKFIILFLIVILIILLLEFPAIDKFFKKADFKFKPKWRKILLDKVSFYRNLNREDKKKFELKIIDFLFDYKIKGEACSVNDTDRLLIAASAIIPVFNFKNWHYVNLDTIYLYPDSFTINNPMIPQGARINGLVGTGNFSGAMLLSRKALYNSFKEEFNGKNTGIHEFLHLLDMEDGDMDGVPKNLLSKQYIIPWIKLIETEIDRICDEDSILSDYACTNRIEFFAEAGVSFFEEPELMKQNYPELYKMLERIFIPKK